MASRGSETHVPSIAENQSFKNISSSNAYKNSFFPCTTRQWNSLDQVTVKAPISDCFRNRLPQFTLMLSAVCIISYQWTKAYASRTRTKGKNSDLCKTTSKRQKNCVCKINKSIFSKYLLMGLLLHQLSAMGLKQKRQKVAIFRQTVENIRHKTLWVFTISILQLNFLIINRKFSAPNLEFLDKNFPIGRKSSDRLKIKKKGANGPLPLYIGFNILVSTTKDNLYLQCH